MKFPKIVTIVCLLIVFVFALAACAPVATAVPVPPELQEWIRLGLEVGIVFILTQLAKAGLDFSGYKAQILAAIFGAVMVVIDSLLTKIPVQWESLAGALLNLIVVILASYGVHAVYKIFKK